MLEVGSGITEGAIRERGYRTVTDTAELLEAGFTGDQLIVPTLLMPVWSVDGENVAFQHRPNAPRERDGKPVKYESLPGQPPRIDVPPIIRQFIKDPARELWITEGIKKADSAAVRALCCIGLVGVWNWRGTNSKGGSTELADWEGIAIKGRVIYIAFDNDVMVKPPVRAALRRLAGFLKRRGAREIRPVLIPAINENTKGLDDFFAAGGEIAKLYDCVNRELLAQEGIVINGRALHDVSSDALGAVVESNDPPVVFVRAGELARVIEDERGIPKIESFGENSFRGALSRCATFIRVAKKEGPTEVYPPKDVVQDILSLGAWPELPPIISVTRAPVLAPNGKLSMHPGYCPDSHFYIAAKASWPEWTGTVTEAVQFILDDMLVDFPFADDASAAHALALMLLPIVRPIIDGPTPLHLFGAHVPGSGKSKLATVCLMPTCGNYIATTAAGRDEEEWRKKISSALLEGRPYIFLDNLSRKLDSDALAKGLTDMEWNDRMITTFRNINVPVRCAWVATANNVELSRDILRRTLWCHIDPNLENPEERTTFAHDPINLWVAQNRPKIVAALCKLISAWLKEGRPEFNRARIGSYEEWGKSIGGILEVARVPGFLGNIGELRAAANSEELAWADFYTSWWEKYYGIPVKPSMLLEMFLEDDELAGRLTSKDEAGKRTQLGHQIKKRIGMVCNGMRIELCSGNTRGSNSYRLTKSAEGKPVSSRTSGVSRAESGVWSPESGVSSGVLGGETTPVLDSNQQGLEGFSGVLTDPFAHTGAHIGAYAHVKEAGETPPNPSPGSKPPQNPTANPTGHEAVTF